MADVSISYPGMSDDEHRRHLRRALIASTVGTTIEWYDFLLYGTVSALVFGLDLPRKSDPLMGVLASFGTFFHRFRRAARSAPRSSAIAVTGSAARRRSSSRCC